MSAKYEPGSLISVRMVNFMKHSNLCIDLKPHVNFITGRNGSGKSSILVAISVGLGSTSRLSGRGSNLADLIKDGQNKAIITITIQNGPDGYNYNVYGNTIVIKRSITKSSNNFEIEKFKNGTKQQTQIKEELERIRNYFNIQIDNPCSIMHQDTAREFIGTSTPNKKYDLFMRGTLLSRLRNEINTIKDNIKNVELQKQQRIEEKAALDQEYEKQQRLYTIVQEADSIHQRMHDLEDELAWSHYYTARKIANETSLKYDEASQQVGAKQQTVDALKEEKSRAQKEYDNSEQTMREARLQITKIKDEIDKLSSKLAPVKAEISNMKAQKERKNNSIKSLDIDIKKKKEKLEQKKAERDRVLQEAQRAKLTYIETRETELHKLEPELADLNEKFNEINATSSELQQQESRLLTTQRELNTRYQTTKEKYDSLKRAANPDRTTSGVSGRGYAFKPIGPLLNYIHMKDGFEGWNVAAQHIIGKSLDMYIVNSRQDELILRRTNQNASIIITNFTVPRYNIGNPQPPCNGAARIIDTLHFTDETIVGQVRGNQFSVRTSDIIFNVIVDQFNADRTWCIENELQARDCAFKGRVNCAITKNGVQYKMQNGYEVRLGAKSNTSKIGQDFSERIQQLNNEMTQQKNDADRAKRDYDEIHNRVMKIKRDKSSIESKITGTRARINKLKAEIANPPSGEADVDDRITALGNQIENYENKLKEERDSLVDVEKRLETLGEEKKKIQEQINETKNKLTSSDIDKTANDQLYRQMKQAERQLDNATKELDQIKTRAKNLENELGAKQKEAASVYEKAKKHSPEKEQAFSDEHPPRSTKQLSALLTEERRKYEEAQKTHELDFTQVRNQYEKIKHDVQRAETYLNSLSNFIDTAQEGIDKREVKLEEMRRSIVRRTKVSFLQYQSKRKYTGKLKFNHETGVIDIAVKQKADSEFTDVSNLSGGEKSFCLVSLLLSLWEVMECPFYCVDEFDVFMDEINRQAATSLLVSGAQQMSSRQFIFITPLSLDHLKNAGEDVAIFEVSSNE